LSLVSFLVVLGVLILVHELGHFIVAKRLGVRVERFSFGFGPKLFSFKKGDTEYLVSAILLGGYVKMAGDDPTEKLDNKNYEFLSRRIIDRFKIIFAGPFLNYVLAFVIFSVIFMFGRPTTEIGGFLKDYPAEKAGLMAGDKITAINGKRVEFWEDMTEMIYKSVNGPMKLSVERNGSMFEKEITPVIRQTKDIFGKETKIALIGITPSQKLAKTKNNFLMSLKLGFFKLMNFTFITYKALWMIMTGSMSFRESLSGPIGIFMITGQAARLGFIPILHLVGILSASLAIFNLLPIPILDGGHILFLALEKIMGRPLSAKTQERIMNTGMAFLILLTVLIFYNDIIKFGLFEKALKLFKH